ncbi:MAG TPA: PQQ-dependent sugar dehydrogenase, partial [Ardenticatenaceae bacterium]|nr:PQQ-dependent sugar dehydrogenase [Ardenticatenaceae bacterium]
MSAKTIRPLPAVLFLAGLAVALLLVPRSPSVAAQTGGTWPEIELLEVTGGLSRPVYITHAGDGSGRLFVVERAGRIRIVRNGTLQATPFLDIAGRVRESGSEEGLLSVAFAPGYAANGRFYVYYTN